MDYDEPWRSSYCLVISKPIAKVTRVADVKTVIAYRPKYIDVIHQLSVTLGA
jgi:hypothetical protein